jgi:monoamine oxidase
MEGTLASLWDLIGDGMDAYCADCREVFPIPYEHVLTGPLLEADDLSMADRIAQLDVSDAARAIIDGFWAINCNRPADECGLTHALHWVAGTGGDWRVFNEACARYKLADGLGALVEAVHTHAAPNVVFGDAARVVEQTEAEVVVLTENGREIRARGCVVALPLNVLGTLEFRPALSNGKQQIIAEGAPTGGFKLWARTDRPLDASYLCMASGDQPLTFARTEDTVDSGTILGFYGPDKRRLDRNSRDAVQHLVQRWIPEARIAEVWSYDWAADPFSRETWRVARPGQLSRYASELCQLEGNVRLAGADLALGAWNGFVDGAIESGLNAARDLAAQLNGRPPV